VDDLLDVTRISRGKVELHRDVLDLRDVLRRTCEDHEVLFEQGQIELHLELPDTPACARVDPARIAQVVGNLLQNANKFTHPHGLVTVGLRADHGRAEIRVRDTGIGMEPALVEHMFEPFMQGKRRPARARGGLGVGLALAKGLVELHGGTITAHSEGEGRGSEFMITLPLVEATRRVVPVRNPRSGTASPVGRC
jgi:signal transduction histidine kinase